MSGRPDIALGADAVTADTEVLYPDGETRSTGVVALVVPLPTGEPAGADAERAEEHGVVFDRTAFHPVDTAWPDQPSDAGTMRFGGETVEIRRAVMGAVRDGELFVGDDVPVRTGAEGWTFCVVHVVEGPAPAVGDTVEVEADPSLRAALSAGHTACHLAALALDAALADAWSKPVSEDPLGSPAFDALAIQTSRIEPFGSVDVYRIGKSLRRKGFSVDALDDPAGVAARANARLAGWVSAGGAVRIEREATGISARRTWTCELPEGRVAIPCGGTHLSDLAQLAQVEVSLERADVTGGVELIMRTAVRVSV